MCSEYKLLKVTQRQLLDEVGFYEPYHQDVVDYLKSKKLSARQIIAKFADGMINLGIRLKSLVENNPGVDWPNEKIFHSR